MKLSIDRTYPALLLVAVVVGACLRSQAAADDGLAVVELFTSEGCSSCPPADQVMSDLAARYADDGRDVFWLGLHVDYWNKLGWTDRFSTAAYTQRQYEYARVMRKSRVYTPQMIVDGQTEFVGSRRAEATRAIDAALDRRRDRRLTLSHLRLGDRKLSGQVQLQPGAAADIVVALTESGLVSQVESGENEGRTLHHDHVVRVLLTGQTDSDGRGHFRLNLPDDAEVEQCRVVVVAQSQRTMRVAAAASAALAELD